MRFFAVMVGLFDTKDVMVEGVNGISNVFVMYNEPKGVYAMQ